VVRVGVFFGFCWFFSVWFVSGEAVVYCVGQVLIGWISRVGSLAKR
jgi:hypothetical protein